WNAPGGPRVKMSGTGDPLHTRGPGTVASFRTWRGWRECVARDRCLTHLILTSAAGDDSWYSRGQQIPHLLKPIRLDAGYSSLLRGHGVGLDNRSRSPQNAPFFTTPVPDGVRCITRFDWRWLSPG